MTMARVAMLAHVKESTVVEPPPSRAGARIPWTGGKIVSNKDQALRKFYERKLRKDALSPEQRRALEASIAKLGEASPEVHDTRAREAASSHHHKSKHDVVHKTNATAKRMAHRAHVKVSGKHSSKNQTVTIVNGRVVGPRKDKASVSRGAKPTASKAPSRHQSAPVALEDKLGMSLDALVKRSAK